MGSSGCSSGVPLLAAVFAGKRFVLVAKHLAGSLHQGRSAAASIGPRVQTRPFARPWCVEERAASGSWAAMHTPSDSPSDATAGP
jgi:hypothetical protein